MTDRWPPEVTHTADGEPIAEESPRGASVVVRRRRPGHAMELLILHRRDRPATGRWAWTPPSGCRRPGEPVEVAIERELAEETGLTGPRPWAVDVSGTWAVTCVDVDHDVAIDLVDPEHDDHAWLSVTEAVERVSPSFVVDEQIARAVRVPPVTLTFRPMTAADLPDVARWQRAEHVRVWFDAGGLDTESAAETIRARFAARLAAESAFRLWVVEIDGAAAGYVQSYLVVDHPDLAAKSHDPAAAAFDYVIGDPDLVGRGLGTRMIWEFCRDVLAATYPEAPRFLAAPSHRNNASLRALEKCGFTQGWWIDEVAPPGERPDTDIVCTLDRHHWFGPVTSPSSARPSSNEV